jgi:hypothetical protein
VNGNLLNAQEPFLCLQCHEGHRINTSGDPALSITADHARSLYTRCTDCHSTIHGTDIPSNSGNGRLTR